ncbi:ABC transporter ATP-binding protein [Szabonella alba]|uniref:ABC transporter ATP-binding protein n=1 Tax=Szabonella alba TaxID=2804194 RepID=A0A8K0Y1I3_9RHOB|nr:ABC transporter ATP-binding protein [Szabonella alba]MBL4917912.1 ABC transporter ATP-binding protein [Szabonella alba]
MGFLQLTSLSKRFGTFTAVEDFNLDIEKGEFVSLLGPSGCGKTTTLQMIAGFLEPTAGRITVEGEDLVAIPSAKRNIGIVFQSYALFPHLTVAQNIAFGLEMRGITAMERSQRIARAIDIVHLKGFEARFPKQLSGGQQQRVALARAIVIEPRILLLDEPMSNLDAKLREDMQLELRQIQQELGITTLLVTHDQHEAMALSDRIAVMQGGRIVQIGAPYEIYENPSSRFVSTFLGKSNLLPDPAQMARQISLRPEKTRLVPAGQGKLQGRVTACIFFGAHWLYQVDTDHGLLLAYEQNLGAARARNGETVGIDWDEAHLRHLEGQE